MAEPPRPRRPTSLVRRWEGRGDPSSEDRRPLTGELLAPLAPDALDRSPAFADVQRGALAAFSQSPAQAFFFELTARRVERGWGHVARAVHAMADARNAAGHCAKVAAELQAETRKLQADAALHVARAQDELAELDDRRRIRQGTFHDRLHLELARIRSERRDIEGEFADREARRQFERADDAERDALDRDRLRASLVDQERRSRAERDRSRQERLDADYRAAAARRAEPAGPREAEDEVERVIEGVGTEAVRRELREFFRAAIYGAGFEDHPLAPLANYVVLRLTALQGVPFAQAVREAARVVAAKLAVPRERWPPDLHARGLRMVRDLEAAIEARNRERVRDVLDREESMFDGTAPLHPQDF